MGDGPPYTIQETERLSDGRVRLLVRIRGGRLVRLFAPSWAADPANMAAMIEQIISTWPEIPDPRLTEG